MDRYFQAGDNLQNPSCLGEYAIKNIVGTGATCAVYYAEFVDQSGVSTEHLLKEFNPRGLKLARDDNGFLHACSEQDALAFEIGLRRFCAGYEMQINVRRTSEMKNSTSNVQNVFDANGTCYIDMTVMAGETYEKVEEKTLYDLLKRIRAITKIVGSYHKNGLLHLDVKPENIFTLPETAEMVQIFDFDSVVEKTDAANSAFLSYTQNWAAQEQILPNRRSRICEATDIFAIGEILFYKLMGRHSEAYERSSFASYTFDCGGRLLEGVNPRIIPLLADIFKHTICNVASKRYQNASDLLERLEEAIPLADPHEPFLQHHLPPKPAFFIGRDSELLAIEERLRTNDKLFINGMGGIGKSELVKQYAYVHKEEYDAVIFSTCNTDLESLILDDAMLPVSNFQPWPDEKERDYFIRKYRKLKQLCNERVLIIVDNFNDLQDKTLNKLLQLNCKMLFTTRCNAFEYNYPQMPIEALAEEFVWEIFHTWYKKTLNSEDHAAVEQILELYQGHTMAVELIAKQMYASCVSPREMLGRLNTGGFGDSGKERIHHNKDGKSSKHNIYAHIRRLFDVSELSEEQVYILANLSLIPPSGIDKRQFHDWCRLGSYEDINILVESGWVRMHIENDGISLHPIIADMMHDELEGDFSVCEQMVQTINDCIANEEFCEWDEAIRHKFIEMVNYMCFCLCKLCSFSTVAINFIVNAALELHLNGKISSYISYIKKAIKVHEQTAISLDENTPKLHNALGILYMANDKFRQAETHLEKSLEIKLNDLDVMDTDAATFCSLYCDLGILFNTLGQFKKAKENFEKAQKICIQASSDSLASVYTNLASACSNLGEYKNAEKYLHQSLQIYREVHGKMSPEVAIVYGSLGTLYGELGEWPESRKYYTKALSMSTSLFGKQHAYTAYLYDNLGTLYEKMGIPEEAEKYCCEALQIRKNIYGENHSETAISYNNLGWLYQSRGELDRAEPLFAKTCEIFENAYGMHHPSTAGAYSNLSALYFYQGDVDKAQKYSEKSSSIIRDYYGEDHPRWAVALNHMGSICLEMKGFDKAEKYFMNALNILAGNYGEYYGETATICNNLCFLYQELDQLDKAIIYCERVLSIKTRIYGEEHSKLVDPFHTLGSLYSMQKQYDNATHCFLKAFHIWERTGGECSSDAAILCADLAFSLCEQQQYEDAISFFEKSLEMLLSVPNRDEATIQQIREEIQKLKNE